MSVMKYKDEAGNWIIVPNGVVNSYSKLAVGSYVTALNAQLACGIYNAPNTEAVVGSTTGTLFTVGNGTSDTARSNVFRVSQDGKCRGSGSWVGSGADYAEMYEWLDGNENADDRRGRFVTLDGNKIKYATSNDYYILGVVSADPVVIGDHSDYWHGRWVTDIFGARVIEKRRNENGVPVFSFVESPEYDPTQEYIPREARKEWDCVGTIGKLVVIDDGTCVVNGYCGPSADGIATKTDTGYRVMERIDDTHVRIVMK